jgi:hypothetical protein
MRFFRSCPATVSLIDFWQNRTGNSIPVIRINDFLQMFKLSVIYKEIFHSRSATIDAREGHRATRNIQSGNGIRRQRDYSTYI